MLGTAQKTLQDPQEMRVFYESLGLSEQIIERAITWKFGSFGTKPPAVKTIKMKPQRPGRRRQVRK